MNERFTVVRFRDAKDGKLIVEVPDGEKGYRLSCDLLFKGYRYYGSGAFIIPRWAEVIHYVLDRAKETGLKVEGLEK